MSGIWQLPPVRDAVLAVASEWRVVRQQRPDWPPLRALREAKRRHVHELVDAVTAITRAEELARHGAWKTMPHCSSVGEAPDEPRQTRQQAAAARHARILELAAAHPDWSHRRLADYLGCSSANVGTVLLRVGIRKRQW